MSALLPNPPHCLATSPEQRLRVLSFNILAPQFIFDPVTNERYLDHYPTSCNIEKRSRSIARTIKAVNADFVLLQEVQDFDFSSLSQDNHVVHGRHRTGYWLGSSPHGNAILFRKSFTLLSTQSTLLSPDGNMALLVRARISEQRVVVAVCVHLEDACGLEPGSKEATNQVLQMQTLAAWLPTVCSFEGDSVCLLGGDFNSPPQCHPLLVDQGFVTPMTEWKQKTVFDAACDDLPIDLVYVKPLHSIVSVIAHEHAAPSDPRLPLHEQLSHTLDTYGSDHLPVWVDFSLQCGYEFSHAA